MSARLVLPAAAANVATSLTLDTPAQATPNASFTMTGTYQGSPQSLDYNFGAGWVQASSVIFSGGIYSFTVPAGMAAGSYDKPQIRDHYAPSVTGTAGNFVVSAWTPETLSTSPGAKAVFEFNANDPGIAAVASDQTVHSVLNSVNASQSLTAEVASGGNGVVIADNSGSDGTHRVLQLHPSKVSPDKYDPATDWLGAGGINGSAGSALVNLANSTNLSTNGSFTTIIAMKIDTSYSYEAGQIWGSLATSGQLQYAQLRVNLGSGVQGAYVTGGTMAGTSAGVKGDVTAGWHVLTMIKTAGTLTYRLDGKQVAASPITSTDTFTAQDFLIGGGFPPASSSDAYRENGVPPPFIGEFQAYSGALSGSDLANAEKLAGNAIGLSLTPMVPVTASPTIALSSPGTVQEASVGAGVTITETITTTNLSGSVYEEVLTSSGAVESGYQAVALAANGTASVSVHLAHTGDTIRAVDNTGSPIVTANSTAVTITDPVTQLLAAVLPSPLYTGTQMVTGTGGVVGLQLERITQGSYNTPGQSGWVAATVASDGSWSAALTFSKPGMLSHVYAENGGSSKVVDLVDGTPTTPGSTPAPTITVAAPGTIQETAPGVGVTANETVTTSNLSGSVYEEVLTASGTVETGYQAVALATNGTASFSVHLAHTGDVIKVVDNSSNPTVTAVSSAVTITDPAPANHPLSAILPSPLYTGAQTVTGTGGVAGLQLERITQGSYNTPGQSGWVAATVASDGSWSVSLTFSKPGMLAHVYAENGGSSTVVDLIDGTPTTAPSLGQAVRNVTVSQSVATQDFARSTSSAGGSGQTIVQSQTTHSGSVGSLLNDLPTKSASIVLLSHHV